MLSILHVLITAILLFLNIQGYSITPLHNNPGLYFEPVKNFWEATSSIKLKTTINLQPLFINEEVLVTELRDTIDLCPHSAASCDFHFSRSKIIFERLAYAIKINDRLQEMSLPSYHRDQTLISISDSSNKTINTQLVMKKATDITCGFQSAVDKISAHYVDIRGRYFNNSSPRPFNYYSYGTTLLSTIGTFLEAYSITANQVLNAILLAQSGSIAPDLLPQHWIHKLPVAEKIDAFNQEFLSRNIHTKDFDKISTVQVEQDRTTFNIIINVPVFLSQPFLLYRMHPVPIKTNNAQVIQILPRSSYLVNNAEMHAYVEHLEPCVIRSMNIFCNTQLIFKRTPDCESQLLTAFPNYQDCNYAFTKTNKTTWINLPETNEWLFSAPLPEQLNISCSTNQESRTIEGLGILSSTDPCQLSTDDVYIYLQQKKPHNPLYYLPTFPLYIPPPTKSIQPSTSSLYFILYLTSLISSLILSISAITLSIYVYNKPAPLPMVSAPLELLFGNQQEIPDVPLTTTTETFKTSNTERASSLTPSSSPGTTKRVRINSNPEVKYLEPYYENSQTSGYVSMKKEETPRRNITVPPTETDYILMNEVPDSVIINIYDLPPPPRELLLPDTSSSFASA